MVRVVALLAVIFSLHLLPSHGWAEDDLHADKSVAEKLLDLKETMLKTRDNRVLYLSQFKTRFGKEIETVTLHRGADVQPQLYGNTAWIVLNFKDGSSAMVVANMGLQTIERVIPLTQGERKAIKGMTPVAVGNNILPHSKTATAYDIKDHSRLLDIMADYRLNMGTVEKNDSLVTGHLEYVPNVNRPGTRVPSPENSTPSHNSFQQRIKDQSGANRSQQVQPRTPGAPRR